MYEKNLKIVSSDCEKTNYLSTMLKKNKAARSVY